MRGEIFNKNNLLVLLILISIFSFFFGFYFEENSAGGGKADFNNTWRNLQMFETNDQLNLIKPNFLEILKFTKFKVIKQFAQLALLILN